MKRYDTPVSLLNLSQQLEDVDLRRHVQRARRLVADHEPRVQRERPGDRDPLPLSAGELAREPPAGVGGQVYPPEQFASHGRARPRRPRTSSGSMRMSSTVIAGLSDEYGSWKIGLEPSRHGGDAADVAAP